jgi:hypothetical protein
MDERDHKAMNEELNQPSCLGDVICRLSSPTLIKPLYFDGEPLYYKINGMYGYLMPSGKKVLWFYSDADGGLFYDELEGWSVLNGI